MGILNTNNSNQKWAIIEKNCNKCGLYTKYGFVYYIIEDNNEVTKYKDTWSIKDVR